jgi:hypothetical protein
MNYQEILYAVDRHVAPILLHHPETLNAFTSSCCRNALMLYTGHSTTMMCG